MEALGPIIALAMVTVVPYFAIRSVYYDWFPTPQMKHEQVLDGACKSKCDPNEGVVKHDKCYCEARYKEMKRLDAGKEDGNG